MEKAQILLNEMKFRGFNNESQKIYAAIFGGFLKVVGKGVHDASKEEVENYLGFLKSKGHKQESIMRVVSAIKFAKKYFEDKAPKKEKKYERTVPLILGQEEIKKIVTATTNAKHRLILKALYGFGLRVSEVQDLKPEDIDFESKKVEICGLGKCRFVALPETLGKELQSYMDLNDSEYIFTGRDGSKINSKTIQKVFENALFKSGINKKASCNTLRHSFAVHLLENGTDIKVIQKLLGHSKLDTTKIYEKLVDFEVQNIKSPLDSL